MRSEIDFGYGLFSRFPGTPWFGGLVGRGKFGELIAVGLTNVTGRSGRIILNSSGSFDLEVFSCRRPLEKSEVKATWGYYDPVMKCQWQQTGAKGMADAELIGCGAISTGNEFEICVEEIPAALLVGIGAECMGLSDIFGWIEV